MLGLAESVVGVAGKVLDKFVADKDLKTKLEAELQKELLGIDKLNALANVEASKHPSIFVSGSRPAILWICAFGLGWQFVLQPVFVWALTISGSDMAIPIIPTEGLMSLTLSMLGLGAMRSAEKFRGTARENMRSSR